MRSKNSNGHRVLATAKRLLYCLPICLAGQGLAQSPPAMYGFVVPTDPDPLLSNLTIPATAPTQGMWSATQQWPLVPLHVTVMPDGRVLSFGTPADGESVQDGRTLDIWNPAFGFTTASHLDIANGQLIDSFCASAALLPQTGSILITGGGSAGDGYTSYASSIVNPSLSTALNSGFNVAAQRWYSSMTTLADGRVIVTGGGTPYAIVNAYSNPSGQMANISTTPEVFTVGKGWTSLFNASSTDAFGPVNNRAWYPRQWVTPTGQLFGISTDIMWQLDPVAGTIKTLGNFKTTVNPNTLPNVGPTSTAVMYDTGLILQAGGNGYNNGYASPSSPYATIININGSGVPKLTETSAMSNARQWANSLVLPDGRVLVTGGTTYADNAGSNAVYASELWNPSTGKWLTGASAANYRGYHSTTALLPDGVVLSGGGGVPGPFTQTNVEIYYPPYLFTTVSGKASLAKRPVIISYSGNSFNYGGYLNLQMSDNSAVAEVSLIGMSNVTHSFNMGQRRMKLAFRQSNSLLTVTLPANANIAPPGYYLISVLNGARVPSAGVILAINAASPPAKTGPTALLPVDGVARSFEASNYPGYVVRHYNFVAYLNSINPASASALDRNDASFTTVQGLANANCYSFQSVNYPTRYLRSSNFQLRLDVNDSSAAYAADATFCASAGLRGAGVSLESYSNPGYYWRHQNFQVYLQKNDGSSLFAQDSSFYLAQEWLPVDANLHSLANLTQNGDPVRHYSFVGYVAPINSANITLNRTDASFYVRSGLGNAACYSFESPAYVGYFLQNQSSVLKLVQNDGSAQFAQDSTFCLQTGLAGQGFSLSSLSAPSSYLRQNSLALYLNPNDGTSQFLTDATFSLVPAP